MKAIKVLAATMTAAACSAVLGLQSSKVSRTTSRVPFSLLSSPTILFAGRKRGSGFGLAIVMGDDDERRPKYSADDKSYGRAKILNTDDGEGGQTVDESSMADFFSTHVEWEPLFRGILLGDGSRGEDTSQATAMASPILFSSNAPPQDLWGISTLERRYPWRLLPSKPTSDASLRALSTFLDEWQRSLLDIPLDALVTGVNDLHFLEEGRRTIAVTRFHVLDEYQYGNYNNDNRESTNVRTIAYGDDDSSGNCDWETELFRTCWSEIAHLTSQDCADTGSLVLLPKRVSAMNVGLEVVRNFVEINLIHPIRWLGRDDDWEIVAMEREGLAVRLLYKLSNIPDIERSQNLLSSDP